MSRSTKQAQRPQLKILESESTSDRTSTDPVGTSPVRSCTTPAGGAATTTDGAARAEGRAPLRPDPEVRERPARRRFTGEFKRRIVEEADACREPGEIGALLRRHGLYSSHLVDWRAQYRQGALNGLTPRRRGPKPQKNPLADRVAKLEREKARLEKRLLQAETIIEVQKKLSVLLGIPLSPPNSDENA
jgi:transposase